MRNFESISTAKDWAAYYADGYCSVLILSIHDSAPGAYTLAGFRADYVFQYLPLYTRYSL